MLLPFAMIPLQQTLTSDWNVFASSHELASSSQMESEDVGNPDLAMGDMEVLSHRNRLGKVASLLNPTNNWKDASLDFHDRSFIITK